MIKTTNIRCTEIDTRLIEIKKEMLEIFESMNVKSLTNAEKDIYMILINDPEVKNDKN